MALQVFANIDRNSLPAGLVFSVSNLGQKTAPGLVAGDKILIDIYLTSKSGLLDIQSYGVKLALGEPNSKPSGGTFNLSFSGGNTDLAFDCSANDIQAAILGDAGEANTTTEIAPFTFVTNFTTSGSKSLPSIDSSSLTPSSTASFQKLITGDSSTNERWLIRLYKNPIALIDGSWTNIEPVTGEKGIRGSFNLGTQGVFDLLDGNDSAASTLELEIADSSGNLQTVFQTPVTVNSQVIGESISGVIPAPVGIPTSAITFLNSFPNPNIQGNLSLDGEANLDNDVNIIGQLTCEGAIEFQDDLTVSNGGIELQDGGLELTGGGDVEISNGGKLKAGALEVNSTDGTISSTSSTKRPIQNDESDDNTDTDSKPIRTIRRMTQSAYNALASANNRDANTLYIIVD